MLHPSGVTAVYAHPLPAAFDLIAAFELLRADPFPWLLESALPSRRLGRFSFAGSDPYLVLRAFGERVELDHRRPVREDLAPGRSVLECDPLDAVRRLMPPRLGRGALRQESECEAEPRVPFVGGAVGYFGYELAQCVESVSLHARNDLGLPDLVLLFTDRLLAVDAVEGRALAVGLGFGVDEASAAARAAAAAEELAGRFEECHAGSMRQTEPAEEPEGSTRAPIPGPWLRCETRSPPATSTRPI